MYLQRKREQKWFLFPKRIVKKNLTDGILRLPCLSDVLILNRVDACVLILGFSLWYE